VLGAVSDRSIKVWARSGGKEQLSVRLWPADSEAEARCSAPVPFTKDEDATAVAALEGLEPATAYTYRVELIGEGESCGTAASSAKTFRTLPKAGSPARVRFAVGADVRGSDVPGFAAIAAAKPDFVLMIGDNVYADDDGYVEGDFDASWKRYRKLYQRVWGGSQFRSLFASTPVFMSWDDHEIMENYWKGKDDLRYGVARSLFDSYQANHNPNPIHAGELYYSFRAGDIGFFVLDVRTHRDSNEGKQRVDPAKTMLGTAQRKALEDWLADDANRVRVIVSAVIFSTFRTTGADSWRAFEAERFALLDTIAAHGDKATTIILSGDQHWSAVLRNEVGKPARYTVYEFQTTPLGSGLRAAPEKVDDTVLALDNTHRVFGLFDIDTQSEPPRLDFTLCAVGEPCNPHAEPPPRSIDHHTATVPYSLSFVASDRGLVLR
jgi:alkaline phosphatase D